MVDEHFRRNDASPVTRLACNSLSAICGLAVGGLGIGILPVRLYLTKIATGELKTIEVKPELPRLQYFIAYRASSLQPVCQRLALIIKDAWDGSALAEVKDHVN